MNINKNINKNIYTYINRTSIAIKLCKIKCKICLIINIKKVIIS